MPRKKKNIHYTYKTTCLITKRYYVGIHSTNNIDDGYMGSGKRLRYSLRKYGIENHKKEILNFFENRESLVENEKKMITELMLHDKYCMNLVSGGTGGFISKEGTVKGAKIINSKYKDKLKEWRSKGGLSKFKKHGIHKDFKFDWTGKKHTSETKEIMSNKKRGLYCGHNNSQYGTCWITKDGINKKIKKTEYDFYSNLGWNRGRK